MGLTRLAIVRPIAILMVLGALVAMGLNVFLLGRLKVDRFPALNFPFVSISVAYPGATAQDVEALVVKPLEDAVAGAPSVVTINGTAADGFGSVSLQLADGTDATAAAVD